VDHRRGTDPTPQGRNPEIVGRQTQTPTTDSVSEKYENSTPGPSVQEDGTYFFGYKRENAYPRDVTKE
jgi:hypothetical protein